MTIEEELCTYFKGNDFHIFMEAWKKQFEKYGRAGGTISVALHDENRECISEFLGKNYYHQSHAKIRYSQVKKAIENSRFEGADFNHVLTLYFQDEILTRKQKKQIQEEEYAEVFSKLMDVYENTKAAQWLKDCIEKKEADYGRMIQEIKKRKNKFFISCDRVMKAINQLPMWQHKTESMSVFAAQICGDPHAFDYGTLENYLLFQSICYFIGASYQQPSMVEKNIVFTKVGLYQEDITNYCMVAHLSALDEKKKLHQGWYDFYKRYEIWNVNVMNIRFISKIENNCKYVMIIENPSVFQKLVLYAKENDWKDYGFVCTHGAVNYCSYLLMDKIMDSKMTMMYCGDFDPEGLLIADKLKMRYKDSLLLWRYTEADYIKSMSKKEISKKRMAILDHLEDSQIQRIGELIKAFGVCAYQENLLDSYLRDLKEWINHENTH